MLRDVVCGTARIVAGKASIGIPPLNGILIALIVYPLLFRLLGKKSA